MSESPTSSTVTDPDTEPQSPHPPVGGRGGGGMLLRQLECTWWTLRILAVWLLCTAAVCSVLGVFDAPWLTASRCRSLVIKDGEKGKEEEEEEEEEDLLVVRLFSVCNVRSNHSVTNTNCSVMDPKDISLFFHCVQLTHLLTVFLILISCSLATIGLFCCKRRSIFILNGVRLSGLLSALTQTICLALYLRADVSTFFRTVYIDDRRDYRFTGRGLALTLVALSLALTVVAVALQFPVASLKFILDEREIYSRTKRNRPSETSPLICPSAA